MSSSVSNELIKKALTKVKRLSDNGYNNHIKIRSLLSLLRNNPYMSYYDSISDNVNKLLNQTNKLKNNKFVKSLTYNELNNLLSSPATVSTDSDKLLIKVFGWCKSVRKQDGGKLLFVILNDGSCKSNLQIVVHNDSKGFDQVLKSHSGTSIEAQGFLINRFPSKSKDDSLTNSSNNNQVVSSDNTQSNHKSSVDNSLPNSQLNNSSNTQNDGKSHFNHRNRDDYELLDDISNRYELHITSMDNNFIEVLGVNMFPNKYPIAKKSVTMEFLRENAHLRGRSYLLGAVMRVRSALSVAIHLFFQSMGCHYLHTPIITTADCEGAGELFQVTTLFENVKSVTELNHKVTKKKKKNRNKKLVSESNLNSDTQNESLKREDGVVNNMSENVNNNTNSPLKDSKDDEYEITFDNDFFKKKSYLTCSGQLSAENYCCSIGSVYTFGPTFRAENSHTNRHLSEFWMIEPELALVDLSGLMKVSEEFLKFLVSYVLDHCYDDLYYFNSVVDDTLLQRLNDILDKEFVQITYTEVINILQEYVNDSDSTPKDSDSCTLQNTPSDSLNSSKLNEEGENTKFEYNNIYWGMDLQSEHERFISEKVFKCPVIIYNYPKKIKAFYMRLNEDQNTVSAMDLIIPKIGELIGGSQREERYEYLLKSINDNNLNEDDYWWYLDLRKYGTITHSGFGLGFERLVMMITGVSNIKDVIPFPRYSGHSSF